MDNQQVLVSIKCLAYNHEPYIRECLEGFVMQQTNFRFEAIVHDDASTDGTADIIREYAEKYPEIIKPIFETENQYSKHDGSLGRIMREACTGKYIAMCEGDDYWTDPYKLQKQVDFLEEHEEYGMVTTAFQQIIGLDKDQMCDIRYDKDEIVIDDILKSLWIATMTVVYRRDLIKDYKPPFEKLPMGDLPLWGYIAVKTRIKYLKDFTAVYRRLDNSACHFADPMKQYAFSLQAMKVREYYAKMVNKENVVQESFSKNAHYFLEQSFLLNDKSLLRYDLERFIYQYGNPSGYDKLKIFGIKHKWSHKFVVVMVCVSKKLVHLF